MRKVVYLSLAFASVLASCKKEGCTDPDALNYSDEAKKDDGSCEYDETPAYTVPATYAFEDEAGNSTVNFAGQTDRINQALEMMTLIKTGVDVELSAQVLKDMFANTGGNGNGAFSFTSTRQLKDKCFDMDRDLIESYFDSLQVVCLSNDLTASSGQAGVLTSGTSRYLFDRNGREYKEVIEKAFMASVFMYQSLNVYFSDAKMDVDNTAAVNPANGEYYTQMEHSWDEAFGYFAVPTDFPTTAAYGFWGKYCNSQDAAIGSNGVMMANFKKGRAAIAAGALADRDAAMTEVKNMWEKVAAYQAMKYLGDAVTNFGTDQGKMLHVLNEAYGMINSLKYCPLDTRNMTNGEIDAVLAKFGTNFWNISLAAINEIKADIDAKY
ncbi:MAG: DUF4856 domain-containing protein [Bacteroidota bacterium]